MPCSTIVPWSVPIPDRLLMVPCRGHNWEYTTNSWLCQGHNWEYTTNKRSLLNLISWNNCAGTAVSSKNATRSNLWVWNHLLPRIGVVMKWYNRILQEYLWVFFGKSKPSIYWTLATFSLSSAASAIISRRPWKMYRLVSSGTMLTHLFYLWCSSRGYEVAI